MTFMSPVVAVMLVVAGLTAMLSIGVAHAVARRRQGLLGTEPGSRWWRAAGVVIAVLGCAATIVGAAFLTAMSVS
jgi:hypothetical protein